jgi:hypothetical protein
MSHFAEFVRYTTDLDATELVKIRAAAITAVKSAHPDLVDVPVLSQGEDGTWTDVWIYRSQQAAEAANADAENIADFMTFFGALSDVDITAGQMPVDAASPLREA